MTARTKMINVTKNTKLWQAYQAKKQQEHMLFPTEGAKLLGVSEFELLLSSPDSAFLGVDCRAVLARLGELGRVQNIVRNDFAVHEKKGEFINLKLGESMGLMINEGGLDLRFFMKHWAFVLAIRNDKSASIGFYDDCGRSIHKVFLANMNDEQLTKYQSLCDEFANHDHQASLEIVCQPDLKEWQLMSLTDKGRQDFHEQWLGMTDIHQYHGILTKFGLDRASSYHQAPQGMAVRVQSDMIERLFHELQQEQIGLMIFVGNAGMIQIQSGQIHHIKRLGDWINILDDEQTAFNLHLKDRALTQVWLTKRPHVDVKDGKQVQGLTIGIEGFDKNGNSIITLFGERVEGQTQDARWQQLVCRLAEVFKY